MGKRKTFDVQEMKDIVNRKNQCSTCSAETRNGWNSLMSEILMATSQYCGFRSLEKNEVPQGCKSGIEKNNNGENIFPDESRVYYF